MRGVGTRYSSELRAAAVASARALIAADGFTVAAVAGMYRVASSTVRRWCADEGVVLPPSRDRMARRPGACWDRRRRAREMRAGGASLRSIAAELGYGHASSVYYAVRGAR